MYALDEIPANGLSIRAVRDLYELSNAYRVRPHAKRPPCAHCGQTVVHHSYHHTALGVICHTCLYGRERVEPLARPRVVKVVRNRWRDYIPPVRYCACGKALGDYRAKRCWGCEMLRRRKPRQDMEATS